MIDVNNVGTAVKVNAVLAMYREPVLSVIADNYYHVQGHLESLLN